MILSQGEIVANSLSLYLHRHPEIDSKCSKNGTIELYTTDSKDDFDRHTATFFGKALNSKHVQVG